MRERPEKNMYACTDRLPLRGTSNKEWDFLHSLKICVRIKLKVTRITEQHLSKIRNRTNVFVIVQLS